MKGQILSIIVIIACFAACSKDKFQTKPQIKIKNINSKVISSNSGPLVITLEYTDKEGDLGEDTLLSIRDRLNIVPLPIGTSNVDTLHNIIPAFPSKSHGEFEVKFEWANYLHQSDIENDTITFKFVAKDNAGNISDTIATDKIVILKD